MLHILRQIAKTGIRTEPSPAPDDSMVVAARLQENILRTLGRALTIRQVDAGSCNGCELEIHALGNPYYNIEGLGIKFVASPRHADMLLVTGPVSKHMAIALQRTYDATPDPKLVVAVGDTVESLGKMRPFAYGQPDGRFEIKTYVEGDGAPPGKYRLVSILTLKMKAGAKPKALAKTSATFQVMPSNPVTTSKK